MRLPRRLYKRNPDRPFSVFFGLTISRQVLGPACRLGVGHSRERNVKVTAGYAASPHVVDLKTPVAGAAGRPALDLEQKMAILAHKIHSFLVPGLPDEHSRLDPNRTTTVTASAPIVKPVVKPPSRQPASQAFAARRPAPLPTTKRPIPAAPANQVVATRLGRIAVCPLRPAALAWPRQLAVFAAAAALVSLPVWALAAYSGLLQSAAAAATETKTALAAFRDAGSAASRLDASAKGSFDLAAETFAETRQRLRGATVTLAAYATGRGGQLADGDAVLAAGEALASAGSKVTAAVGALESASDRKLPERVRTLTSALEAALPDLDIAAAKLATVKPSSLPDEFVPKFIAARTDLESARDGVRRFVESAPTVLKMLGADGKRRYLVLFQNDRELRPTGGFIGSFALVDLEDGEITGMEIPPGGPYDLRAGLNERLMAPEQLRLVNPRWEFQDANWFADFPASAKTLAWFYEKSGGPTVDGVVAVTSRVMERLLEVVGPVDLPEYGKTVDARNFYVETQKATELEYDRAANRPKQIIADLAPKVLQKLIEGGKEKTLPLMTAAGEALAAKDIQVWFRDESAQAAANDLGWTGSLKPLPGADYLAVVDTNIAGGKTDGVVSEDVRLETSVADDGTLTDTVTITRTHKGKKGDLFTGVKNIDYVRVYAPAGSELLAAEGFEKPGAGYFQKPDGSLKSAAMLAAVEGRRTVGPGGTVVTEESGLAAFGNWMQVEPGETRTAKITYRLPFRASDSLSVPETRWEKVRASLGAYVPLARHKLLVRRQAGAGERGFSAIIRLPAGWAVRSLLPDSLVANGGGVSWTGPLDRDLYLAVIASTGK